MSILNNRKSFLWKSRWGKESFLLKCEGYNLRLLDVGCGNNSAIITKHFCKDCYYVGVDVGDYNQSEESLSEADEYYIFDSEKFAEEIESIPMDFDAVVSSHNIEHCNKPVETIRAMCCKLKNGGKMFFSFPNEESVGFPHRSGTLNFYDDETHLWVPVLSSILRILEEENMKIIKVIKGYKPMVYWIEGGVMEPRSKREKKVLRGTWAYWGFESLIWAEKR